MNYEIAKKLKDAGFSQLKQDGDWYFSGTGHNVNLYDSYYNYEKDEIRIPNLSELIDAVTSIDHEATFYLSSIKDQILWWAETRSFGTLVSQESGSTPEEAVANLWLALHK